MSTKETLAARHRRELREMLKIGYWAGWQAARSAGDVAAAWEACRLRVDFDDPPPPAKHKG